LSARPNPGDSFVYVWTWVLLLGQAIDLGLGTAAQHFIPEYRDRGFVALLRGFICGSCWLAVSIAIGIAPSLAATALLLLFGRPILSLFGAEFTDGYHLMFILAADLLARAAIGPIERLLNMLGEQRICAMVYACAFAINLCLCIVLIPHFGMVAAAVSTASALIIETIMLYIVTKNRLGLHVFVWGR
jgi:O-antigen/teichoic acid export membrane protein